MEDIVAKFLERGKLLTPEALEYIKDKKLDDILKDILISDVQNTVVTRASIERTAQVRIIKNLAEKKKELTAEDFAYFYKTKLDKIKDIIMQRTQKNFVSLNKLDSIRQEVYVTGMVRDIKHKEKPIVELEDITGTVQVIMEDTGDLELDDVVAVRAASGGKVLFGHQIIYPDIPLRRPSVGLGKACFISDLRLNEAPKAEFEKFLQWLEHQSIDMLFAAGDIGEKETFEELVTRYCSEQRVFVIPGEIDKEEEYPQTPLEFSRNNIISLSNPSMVEVAGLKILLIHKMDISMLKKRYLGKQKQILHSDYLVMDDVPDIVHHGHSNEPQVTNYKSVTIVNSGSLLGTFAPVIIDFSTRETSEARYKV